jgi:hypothetical protein
MATRGQLVTPWTGSVPAGDMPNIAVGYPSLPTPYGYNPSSVGVVWWEIAVPAAGTVTFDGALSTLADGTIPAAGSSPYVEFAMVTQAGATWSGPITAPVVTFTGPMTYKIGMVGLRTTSNTGPVRLILRATSSSFVMSDVAPPPPTPPEPGVLGSNLFANAQLLPYGATSASTRAQDLDLAESTFWTSTHPTVQSAWWKVVPTSSGDLGISVTHSANQLMNMVYVTVWRGEALSDFGVQSASIIHVGQFDEYVRGRASVTEGETLYVEVGLRGVDAGQDVSYQVTVGAVVPQAVLNPLVGAVTLVAGANGSNPASQIVGAAPQLADDSDATYVELHAARTAANAPAGANIAHITVPPVTDVDPARVIDWGLTHRAQATVANPTGNYWAQLYDGTTKRAETYGSAYFTTTAIVDGSVAARKDLNSQVEWAVQRLIKSGATHTIRLNTSSMYPDWGIKFFEMAMYWDVIASAPEPAITPDPISTTRAFT